MASWYARKKDEEKRLRVSGQRPADTGVINLLLIPPPLKEAPKCKKCGRLILDSEKCQKCQK